MLCAIALVSLQQLHRHRSACFLHWWFSIGCAHLWHGVGLSHSWFACGLHFTPSTHTLLGGPPPQSSPLLVGCAPLSHHAWLYPITCWRPLAPPDDCADLLAPPAWSSRPVGSHTLHTFLHHTSSCLLFHSFCPCIRCCLFFYFSLSLKPGVGLVVRVVAWNPRVLSSSPVGC